VPVIAAQTRTRFVRYAIGSVAATVTSAVALAVAYRVLHLGPALSSGVAFLAGAVVNFGVSRFWAWSRRQRPGLGRDALAYGALAVATALVAARATTVAESHAQSLDATTRTLAVETAYFAVYAAMFLVKFAVLDRVVFADRSRSQVETTTRA
jgi:putative flippase GtrA